MPGAIPFLSSTTSRFGETAGRPNPHRGHDVAPGGQDFPSWCNGVVVTAGWQSCLGNRVVVRNDEDGYFLGVSHLANIKVSVGQRVSIGTPLGNIGNTGSCSAGRHAHITVSPSSQYPESGAVIDPVPYAGSGSGGGPGGGYNYGIEPNDMARMQAALAKLDLYDGPHDGAAGTGTVTGMQIYLRSRGFLPADYHADGEPGPVYGGGLQRLAAEHGYTGPIDNIPGTQTSHAIGRWADGILASGTVPPTQYDWAAWQAYLRQYGYRGPVDGDPGVNTYLALQTFLAEKFDYHGPIDGEPGENTWAALERAERAGYPEAGAGGGAAPEPTIDWKAWQTFLRDWGYEGPIDGEPGTNTYIALQKFLAAHFGYQGPIDGDPGDFTWQAFDRAVAAGYPEGGGSTIPTPEPQKPLPGAFMVDVSKWQAGISYAALKRAHVEAVVVKAAGRNDGPVPYVADHYHEHVDGTREAGLFVGHYYVPGKGATPTEQARFFAASLYDFQPGDVLMLDNEVLDSNGVLFNDTEVVEFVGALATATGAPLESIWVYAGAKDWRGPNAPWAGTLALPVKVTWAAYGAYPTGPRPDHEPSLQGKIERWDVHQFTSTFRVDGRDIDAMHSPHSAASLFGVPEGPVGPTEPCDCESEAILDDFEAVLARYRSGSEGGD